MKYILLLFYLTFALISHAQTTTSREVNIGKFDLLYVKAPRISLGTEKVLVWDAAKGEVKIADATINGTTLAGGPITAIPTVGFNPGTNLTVKDWITATFYPFVPATISLVSSHLYEVGTSNTITLNHSITANSETIFTSGRIDQLTPIVSSKLTWTGGGSKSVLVKFTPTQGVTDSLNKTFKSYQLVGNNGSPVTLQSSTLTLSSGYPYLYGMSDQDLSSGVGLYAAMTSKVVKTCSSSTSAIFNCSTLKYAYFVFPATCADLTSILDQNGFEQISAFTKYTVNIGSSGLENDWADVAYKVYRSNNKFVTTGENWIYTFKQ